MALASDTLIDVSNATEVTYGAASRSSHHGRIRGTDFPFGQEIGLRYTLRGIVHYRRFTDDDRTAVLHGNASRLFSAGVSNWLNGR